MMPLAAGRFDCKMLYSSPGRSWYRKDLMYGWVIIIIIIKGYFLVVHLCYHDRTMNQCFLPMGQQGEGTARVTHEKVNLRDGLGIRQAPHSTWVWVIFWSWVVLLSLITEKTRPHLGHPAPELSLSVSNPWSQLWITKGCPDHHINGLEAILELQLWRQLLWTHYAYKESSQQSQSSQAHWITRHMSGPSTLYGSMHWSLLCEGVPRLTYKLSIQVLVLQPWFKFRQAQLSCAFHFTMCILNCSSLP